MPAPNEHQLRLGRLLDSPDFRSVIVEWLDSGYSPWAGPVAPDQASDASYVNGRAAFLTQLMEEIHQFYPRQHALIQEEMFNGRRSTQLDGQQRDDD